jgi:DNA-binding HxlR family transcriptional regulator
MVYLTDETHIGLRWSLIPAYWMAQMKSHETETYTINHQSCPRYEHAVQLLGKRWTGLILDALMNGPRRFCEMTAAVEGLSDRVLSDRLRELETEGVVERIVFPQIPVRVEYRLTAKGLALKPVTDAIHTWAEAWLEVEIPVEAPDKALVEVAAE